jgi:hypothetical protein
LLVVPLEDDLFALFDCVVMVTVDPDDVDVEAEELAADDTVLLDCPGVVLVTFGGVCGKHLHNSS